MSSGRDARGSQAGEGVRDHPVAAQPAAGQPGPDVLPGANLRAHVQRDQEDQALETFPRLHDHGQEAAHASRNARARGQVRGAEQAPLQNALRVRACPGQEVHGGAPLPVRGRHDNQVRHRRGGRRGVDHPLVDREPPAVRLRGGGQHQAHLLLRQLQHEDGQVGHQGPRRARDLPREDRDHGDQDSVVAVHHAGRQGGRRPTLVVR